MIVEKINLNKDNLKKIKLIDDEFFKKEKLHFDFYLERYNDEHVGFVLKNDINKIVGYLISVPVKKELYDAIRNGTMINDIYMNPKMFINESKYNYIVSICIFEEYRKKGYGKQLFEFFLNNTIKGKYVSLVISEGGYRLANKYMKLIHKISENNAIFEFEKNN